jgi:DNA-binding MarR family transcriptional regulator
MKPTIGAQVSIVKPLDEVVMPELLDHIGWQLWAAAHAWKDRFDDAMVAEGYGWFRDAKAKVFAVLDFGGTPQALIAERLGITKQAVQQLVDQLVDDRFVERRTDPDDARGRIVFYTSRGAQLMKDANRVKKRLDRAYRRRLGRDAFAALESALHVLNTGDRR